MPGYSSWGTYRQGRTYYVSDDPQRSKMRNGCASAMPGYSSWGTYRQGRTYYVSDDPQRSKMRNGCAAGCFMFLFAIAMVAIPWALFGAEQEFHDRLEAFSEVEGELVSCMDNKKHLWDCYGGKKAQPPPTHITSSRVSASSADTEFGVQLKGALALDRSTEYCQWQEFSTKNCDTCTRTGENGEEEKYNCNCRVTFHYVKAWRSHRINSLVFDQPAAHHNPQRDPYPSERLFARDARAGEIELSHELLDNPHGAFRTSSRNVEWTADSRREDRWYDGVMRFFGFTPGKGDRTRYEGLWALKRHTDSPAAREHRFVYVGKGGFFYSPYEASKYEQMFKYFIEYMEGSLLDWQLGDLVPACTAGDIRVSYRVHDPSEVSVIGAAVEGDGRHRMGIYTTSKNYQLGIVHEGIKEPFEMFEREAWEAKKICFLWRAAMLLWALGPAHLVAAFFGRRLPTYTLKLAAAVSTAGAGIVLIWVFIWREDFGGQLQDAMMIVLLGVAIGLGYMSVKQSQPDPNGESGFGGAWVWLCTLCGAPRSWYGQEPEEAVPSAVPAGQPAASAPEMPPSMSKKEN
eukprot:CAMPEP_0206229804 /NCGR_PEP_ID=MMETSP0047_2-20121206/9895_1 /ASSEMBLY_ACC=CAM_ASM_000192 /TAXON_ID=195065 /ORGANISM="Chroomonas mesostigmatica_cf, Strain CCMP1168" /LENGTH=571 /DNA_ID=CAMNT_0053653133 /DNA_START=33 /DNA_END=1748 /DNA_ORIENTATION=-